MSRWTAVSDLDYYDEFSRHDLVERTCRDCGGPAYASTDEPYQVQVWCGRCIGERVTRAAKAVPARREGAA